MHYWSMVSIWLIYDDIVEYKLVCLQDNLVEAAKEEASSLRNIIAQATK